MFIICIIFTDLIYNNNKVNSGGDIKFSSLYCFRFNDKLKLAYIMMCRMKTVPRSCERKKCVKKPEEIHFIYITHIVMCRGKYIQRRIPYASNGSFNPVTLRITRQPLPDNCPWKRMTIEGIS